MRLVVDSSVIVSGLVDTGADGQCSESRLRGNDLVAPHLMPVEVANILRRSALVQEITEEVGALAHADLVDLPVSLFPYEIAAERAWELRHTVTAYDAWYVALAESLDAPLATLDVALSNATGPRCEFAVPEELRQGRGEI